MNKNKNTMTKSGTVALIGLGDDNKIVVNPGVATKDIINICLNVVVSLVKDSPKEDVQRLFNAALAAVDPELVFGTKEELEAELAEENAKLMENAIENNTVDEEIARLKTKVAADVEAEM